MIQVGSTVIHSSHSYVQETSNIQGNIERGHSYIQNDIDLSERLGLSLGGRFSYIEADIGAYEDPASGAAASFENGWSNFSASARITYDLTGEDQVKTFAGVSQSFRAPNLADLSRFGGSRSDEVETAAVSLEPETFLTFEVGLKAETERFRGSLSLYRTQIQDFITSTPTGNTIGGLREVTKLNSASGFIQGIEAGFDYRLKHGLSVFGNFSWAEGQSDVFLSSGSPVSTREPLSRVQPIIGTGGLRWDSPDETYWIEVSASLAGRADKLSSNDLSDTQRIPPGGTPGYSVISVDAGWEVNDTTTYYFGIENLTNEAYRNHGSGSNEPGLGVVLGINRKF